MTPTITDIIAKVKTNYKELGITLYAPASLTEIGRFENIKGIKLPADVVTFYSFL